MVIPRRFAWFETFIFSLFTKNVMLLLSILTQEKSEIFRD